MKSHLSILSKTSSLVFLLFFFLHFSFCLQVNGENPLLYGYVNDKDGTPLEMVTVAAINAPMTGTVTDKNGYYELALEPDKNYTIGYSYLGFETVEVDIALSDSKKKEKNIILKSAVTFLPDVEIRDTKSLSSHITRIDPKHVEYLPGPSTGVEGLLRTFPGVSSVSELTTQYSVRGGNFDENLIYVNGIEIYRPFLIRSGEQEGLSFVNSDLVSSINFSSGGFDARHGDKMASVLDIKYKTPQEFGGSASMSFLGGSAHVEGRAFDSENLGYLVGVRHQQNQYLLGTLDVDGDYNPTYTDVQTFLTYNISNNWDLSFLGNYSQNNYFFEPEVQRTRFGHFEDARQLTVYFNGQEVDRFTTAFGALSLEYQPDKNLHLQLIGSAFQSDENETFDILGQYQMHQVTTDFDDEYDEATGRPLAVGSFFNHARNYLNAIVWNAEHKGFWEKNDNLLRWGVKYQKEDIYDRLREWTLIDSAGYSIPTYPHDELVLNEFINTRINLVSNRYNGFIQNNYNFENDPGEFEFIVGVRGSYWDLNKQFTISPRTTLLFKPNAQPNLVLRASAGIYHQPPFYRELRDTKGNINKDVKAQESIHFVLGSEYDFTAWRRPFKFTSEIYYKHFDNLIPYEIDNVRIRYYADNKAKGYATGIDLRIHGEFVPEIDSWASLSLMKTEEKIFSESTGEYRDYTPRPTDQLLNFSLYFQDFLPRNPTYKVHLGMYYGTGLPTRPPTFDEFSDEFRMPPYRRVDIGFSKQLIGNHSDFSKNSPLRHINSMWISAEVFNLLQINNTISYMWIRDVQNRMYAVPNYLTSRLINVKLVTHF